ncbi:iron complex transport system ATP-binding protein [Enterococcus sp. DIV2402]|uniref:Iron complex transport system ATP-binding protein n=1 Tax=Candidatus Enterococcus lowellii TaxID=2230877 RepID=A0ABZ2SQT2_9ENTE|nr:ABC transporter ATP-binding protein [Enterococcus sp. DIV2402]MBO0463351.1 ABC transporter ATP-binding protein [Enterococcus sp. DIV2402]
MNHIETKSLAIAYEDALIVNELNLAIPTGKITSIIGPNGCGKSTILKAIGRIIKKKAGVVYLNGSDINKLSTREIAKKMAILPQTPTAPNGLTVSELIAYGRFPHQKGFGKLKEEDKELIDWALNVTKLTEFQYREVDSLSGGQRQRVWIAMALAQQTELILLDEPTTYLDLAHQLEILELLQQLNHTQNCTIAMVLHDLNLAARFSDYMVAISKGKIVRHGTAMEVLTPSVLKTVFQIDAKIVIEENTQRPICLTYNLIKENANDSFI